TESRRSGVPAAPFIHHDGRGRTRVDRAGRPVLRDLDVTGCRSERLGRQPGPFLAEQQHALLGQFRPIDRHRVAHVVDGDDRDAGLCRPRGKRLDIRMVHDVLVAVGHHRAALVPAPAADDVHGVGEERVGAAHDRADVHVVLPVLDGDVERMPLQVEVGDDGVHAPVAVTIDHVAGVTVCEQLRVEVRLGGRVAFPGADAMSGALGDAVGGLLVHSLQRSRGVRAEFGGLLGTPKYGYDFGMPKSLLLPAAGQAAAPRMRGLWLLGPALVAGVAYLDPGNVASNMTAGARYGYLLVWVVIAGNVMAWLIQYLSAKLGLVTGLSLPEVLGQRIRSRWARRAFWLQAELVAMATDIAEVLGGAVALNLLFGIPLVYGGIITGAVSI